MVLLTTWPTVTDGTPTTGTIFNKALTDAMKAAIEANIHSGVNPTVAAKTIIDEVVAARGALASLTARLAVSLDANGVLVDDAVITEVEAARGGLASLDTRLDISLNNDGTFRGQRAANTSQVANVGAGEDDLQTLTSTAGTLDANGEMIVIIAAGTTAANGNAKTIKLYYGATVIASSGATVWNNLPWVIIAVVIRTGAATQLAFGLVTASAIAPIIVAPTTPGETCANAITIKTTGEGVANDDIVSRALVAFSFPN